MNPFLKRANSSDQIKSSMFFSLQFYIEVGAGCCTMSAKNTTVSLFLSFPTKPEKTLAFLHILLT